MENLRWILILAGVAILAVLYFSGKPRRSPNSSDNKGRRRNPGNDGFLDPLMGDGSLKDDPIEGFGALDNDDFARPSQGGSMGGSMGGQISGQTGGQVGGQMPAVARTVAVPVATPVVSSTPTCCHLNLRSTSPSKRILRKILAAAVMPHPVLPALRKRSSQSVSG